MAKQKRTDAELVELGIPTGELAAPPDTGRPPKYGVAVPADPGGPLPRVIGERERAAGTGATRYKIRAARGGFRHGHRYLLARTQAEAEACYRQAEKLAADAALVTVKLPD